MNKLSTILSILLIMLFTACSSNGITSAEEQIPTTREISCRDIFNQRAGSYYGTEEDIQWTMCEEFKQILRQNGLSNESSAAVQCRRLDKYYRDCYL